MICYTSGVSLLARPVAPCVRAALTRLCACADDWQPQGCDPHPSRPQLHRCCEYSHSPQTVLPAAHFAEKTPTRSQSNLYGSSWDGGSSVLFSYLPVSASE